MADSIADMLSKIRNAQAIGKKTVSLPYSKLTHEIAKLLTKERYLASVDTVGKKIRKTITAELMYTNGGDPKIKGTRRVSKLSCRIYKGARALYPVKGGYGRAIITTPKGVLTDSEARKQKVGGEVLFHIW